MKIIGIDPGLKNIGWAVIEKNGNKFKFIDSDSFQTDSKQNIADRLKVISDAINLVIEKYSPVSASVEETFVNSNPKSSLLLGQARGAIILTLAQNSIPCGFYEPMLIKKTVTGHGAADKLQIQKMLSMLLPGAQFKSNDAADAIAIALCHGIIGK